MNGFELAQMVKNRKKTAAIPIIFLTAYFGDDEHVQEGYSTGAVDYLHKPINAAVLRSKVSVFAALHRKTRQSARWPIEALLYEIAERHHAQERLRKLNAELERRVAMRTAELSSESEARFRALAEEMPHLVWETDANGRSTYQNSKWRAYTGLPRGLSRGRTSLAVIHPLDAPAMMAAWMASLQTGVECDTYCRCRRASDGSIPLVPDEGRAGAQPCRQGDPVGGHLYRYPRAAYGGGGSGGGGPAEGRISRHARSRIAQSAFGHPPRGEHP